jgi:hypothetical protein
LRGGELVHESEAEIMLFAAEVDGGKAAAEMAGGIPTDLAAETGSIARGLERTQLEEEFEEDGPQEIPIFGPAGKEAAQPKVRTFEFVNVDDGEVALAGGGNIEAEAPLAFGLEEFEKTFVDEIGDLLAAIVLVGGVELAELFEDLVLFEMDADDVVVITATLDGGPIHDVIGRIASRVAHVRLLKNFRQAGASPAISNELIGSKFGALNAVDDVQQAELMASEMVTR